MTDESLMRLRLQTVAAYRELCRTVRRSGRENVVFAVVMLGFAYFLHSRGMAAPMMLVLYGILIGSELLIGIFKWVLPSAEGVLLDGVVLFVFAVYNLGVAYLQFQVGPGGAAAPAVFFGLFMLLGAVNRFKSYGQLRRLFAERPAPEHVAWFDDLVREIQLADPQLDELVLDLPTRPHWKAKLLGGTAFFVTGGGNAVVAGPDDFSLVREKTDHGTGHRKALLRIHGEAYPEFDLTDASWGNYLRWRAIQTPSAPAAAT